jgi:hypothetical protein
LLISHNDITDSISGWARRLGVTKQCLHQRIDRWGVSIALQMRKGQHAKSYVKNGATRTNVEDHLVYAESRLEPKLDGLSDIIFEYKDRIVTTNLFSSKEKARIQAIKERRNANSNKSKRL